MRYAIVVLVLLVGSRAWACGAEMANDPQAFVYTGQWSTNYDTTGWTPSQYQGEYVGGSHANNVYGYAQQVRFDKQTDISQVIIDANASGTNQLDQGTLDFNLKLYTRSTVTPWSNGTAVPDVESVVAQGPAQVALGPTFSGVYSNYTVPMKVSLPPGDYWLSEEWLDGGIIAHVTNVRYS